MHGHWQLRAMMDRQRFKALWRRRLGSGGGAVFDRLEALYGEPHRYYHGPEHIDYCLGQFDLASGAVPNREAVEMALWFHDAIYVVTDNLAPDNEQRSAELFLECAAGHGSAQFRSDVYRLINVTDHREPPAAPDECYVVDIDLASFGFPWSEFLQKSHELRAEQPTVPDKAYYDSQEIFLRSLLNRPVFCFTEFFRERHERTARENLVRYLSMEKPLKPGALPPKA